MQSRASWKTELAVQRLAYQSMHELEATTASLRLADELCAGRFLECVHEIVLGQICNGFEKTHIEFAADNRGDTKHSVARVAEPRQPTADDFLDTFRQSKIRKVDGASRHPANRGDRSALLQVQERFGREKRIAI